MSRRPEPIDPHLLCRISTLYHQHRLNQEEISVRLGLSRTKIVRLLQQAEAEGIVRVSVRAPEEVHTDLEIALEKRYGLREAVVAHVQAGASASELHQELGETAAGYLTRCLSPGLVIGISWGAALLAMVNALQPQNCPDVTVVQMDGGLGPAGQDAHAFSMCRRLADKLASQLCLLSVPGVVDSCAVKEAILADRNVQNALRRMDDVQVAFVGIGAPHKDSLLMRDGSIIKPQELEQLLDSGVVGDIALRFLNAQGDAVSTPLDERVIGVSLEQLRRVPRLVGVAGGLQKLEVTRAALRGGWLDVLITDHHLARCLLADA